VIACLQRIARLKLADAGEDRIGHWIGERIDLHIYAEIRKTATPAHLIDVAVFCASDDPRIGTAPSCRGAADARLFGLASGAAPIRACRRGRSALRCRC